MELTGQDKIDKATKDALFEEIFMPYLRALYNFAFRLTHDKDEAKDLVQDTYLKAYRFFDTFQKGTNAKAWVFRILKNTFINDYRKKSKEPNKIDYQDVEMYYNTEAADKKPVHDLRIETVQGMLGDEMTKALQSLEVEFRTIILLCDIEEFSYEEIAKILEIPIGTVRSRLHRARNMLKDKILTYAQSMGYKS